MEKPITVQIDDYRDNLISVMNGSGLPAWLQLYVLRPLVAQLEQLAAAQSDNDRKEWEEQKNGD